MTPSAFDRISKRFAARKLSRRQALAAGGAGAASLVVGLAPVAAQEATPVATPTDDAQTTYLFVQSFHAGSIVPIEGQDGRFTVTLEQGTGQTIYFGDRPSRDVGATATGLFLQSLGFPEDNPPNAAMILETTSGETDVAVVELFNPTYDLDTERVTYDVEVLENWQDDLELGFREEPTDLAALAPEFGAAHLLIDDCPDGCTEQQVQGILDCPTDATVWCFKRGPGPARNWDQLKGQFDNVDTCMNWTWCMPCEPYGHTQPDTCQTNLIWHAKCNMAFPECEGNCRSDVSTYDWFVGSPPC